MVVGGGERGKYLGKRKRKNKVSTPMLDNCCLQGKKLFARMFRPILG